MLPARKLEEFEGYQNLSSVDRQSRKRRGKKRRSRVPETVIICGLAACVVLVACLYLVQQVQTMHLTVRTSQLERQFASVLRDNEILQLEIDSTRALATIESIARNELGMVEPSQATIIVTAPQESIEASGQGWLAQSEPGNGMIEVVADWLNRWLPLGGVEAGRIGQ